MQSESLDPHNTIIRDYLLEHPVEVEAIWNRSSSTIMKLQTVMNHENENIEYFTGWLAEGTVLLNLIAIVGILNSLALQFQWNMNEPLKNALEDSISSKSIQDSLFDPIRGVLPSVLDNFADTDPEFVRFVQNFELSSDEWFEYVGWVLLHGQTLPESMVNILSLMGVT